MIRSLAIAACLEAIIIFFLILQPVPPTQPLRGLPSVEIVSLAPDSEIGTTEASAVNADSEAQSADDAQKSTVSAKSKKVADDKLPVAAKPSEGKASANVGKGASGPPTHPVAGDRLDRGVVLISGTNPVYPKHAAAYNIETEVKVKILVNSDGGVESVVALSGDDQWGFSKAVRNAVMNWKFQPGTVSGYSASFYIVKVFKFNLD